MTPETLTWDQILSLLLCCVHSPWEKTETETRSSPPPSFPLFLIFSAQTGWTFWFRGAGTSKMAADSSSSSSAPTSCFTSSCCYFLVDPGVLGLGAFLEMVGILEGLAPLPGRLGVSEASEQTERASCSSEASEASLPRRLLALLPARLPARLAGPLAPRFGSDGDGKSQTAGKM